MPIGFMTFESLTVKVTMLVAVLMTLTLPVPVLPEFATKSIPLAGLSAMAIGLDPTAIVVAEREPLVTGPLPLRVAPLQTVTLLPTLLAR